MKPLSLADIVELAQLSLEKPASPSWLKEQLQKGEPIDPIAKGAIELLNENQFDALWLLSTLQQTPLSFNLKNAELNVMPKKRRGLRRRFILSIGLFTLLLIVFLICDWLMLF